MEKQKYQFIDPSKATSIPVPRELTAEEEAEILECFREPVNREDLQAECIELFRQAELRQLVSAAAILEELDREDKKEAAC